MGEEAGQGGWRAPLIFCAGVFSALSGLVTLVGWYGNVPRLTDWGGDNISMFPNTAVCATVLGLSIALLARGEGTWRRPGANLLALIATAIGVLTLFEHATSRDLGIDRLLIERDWGQNAAAAPMRMGIPGSVSYTLLGLGVVLTGLGALARRIATALGLVCLFIAALSLIGYLYNANTLYALPRITGIAKQTAITVVALGIGMVALVPEWGLAELMSRRDGGGLMARRLLPVFLLVAIVLGWLRVAGQQAGLYDSAFGTAVRTLVEIILFSVMVKWTADSLSRTESELRRNREQLGDALGQAQRVARVKDEFLATLSHELRTPMTAILGWTHILRRGSAEPGDVTKGLEVIERNAKLQSQMIDDLLDMSRILSGKVRLNLQTLDMAEVVRNAVDVIGPGAQAKGVHLEVTNPHLAMSGDPARMQQILVNLLSNAVKFTPKGGRVWVVARSVEGRLEIEVSDTGVGIKPEFLPHVFERFRQQDVATTRKYGGLGIGLAIVRQLVELHGGTVTVASDGEGKGARFLVRLPRQRVFAESAPRGVEGVDLTGLRVLAVDDEIDTREMLKKLLESRGARVDLAGSVREAKERFEIQRPDVVLSDVGMPEEDGYVLMRWIRALPQERGRDVPAVALTAFARLGDRSRSAEAGFDVHLAKPVEPEKLFAGVKEAVGKSV
ncbi:MAG: response regulator [Planctomycetes bacterium]|nr:response regulator [Planctomycetota bacterium]